MNNQSKNRVMYLRDQHNHPVACVYMNFDRKNGQVNYGLSVLNPQDNFKRSVARQLAIGRMYESPKTVKVTPDANNHVVATAVVLQLIQESASTPSRAVKAARRWLSKAQ